MVTRVLWVSLALVLSTMLCQAGEFSATLFAQTPPPAAGQFLLPRSIVIDAARARCYVLDSGLERIVAMTLDGEQVASWPFDTFGLKSPLPADPMMPLPALVVGGGAVYVLNQDRSARQVDLLMIEGRGKNRTIQLPAESGYGAAVTMDADGRLLAAYLRAEDGQTTLVVAREDDGGTMRTVAIRANPCDGQMMNLSITGFTAIADGRIAVGIAQQGAEGYSYTRSWLLQGTVKGDVIDTPFRATHRFILLDGQGKVVERFKSAVSMAGRRGYPTAPCVPLFTSLAFGPDGTVISGGHTQDPFLRIYGRDGALLLSRPRRAIGGQHLAMLVGKSSIRVFAATQAERRIDEIAVDGRTLGSFGAPAAYDLSSPVALAADTDNVFVVTRVNAAYQLARFTAAGRFCWSVPITPPASMSQAQPILALVADRVLIGWRMPHAAGVGWVDSLLTDASPGMPLWQDAYAGVAKAASLSPTPLIIGANGRVYVVREMKEGVRVQAYSATGAFLQQLPTAVQGITAVAASGEFIWARQEGDGLITQRFTAQGASLGMKRVPRPARGANLLPAQANGLWAWLSSTDSLLRFDEYWTVVDEFAVKNADGQAVKDVAAIAGDGEQRIYLAVKDRIFVLDAE